MVLKRGVQLFRILAWQRSLKLALVQPQAEVTVADESLPQALQGIDVATSSAADFDSLLGGAQ